MERSCKRHLAELNSVDTQVGSVGAYDDQREEPPHSSGDACRERSAGRERPINTNLMGSFSYAEDQVLKILGQISF